ncbi:MAG TPA: universal stress protein [Nitrospirota bacterium]
MKVLVPVDGSKHATEGIKVASHYAKSRNAQVFFMTVIPSVADIDLELTASDRDRILESMKKRGEEHLAKAAELIGSLGVQRVSTILATAPSPAQEIVSFSEREKIDLVVIGSRGRNATQKFHLGSVAANVVRHSPCCVYVVKEPCWA